MQSQMLQAEALHHTGTGNRHINSYRKQARVYLS